MSAPLPFTVALCVLLSACASSPSPITDTDVNDGANAATFILVRHAEKSSDDPRDPALSAAGQARVQRLVKLMSNEDLQAVYATPYRRTQLTAKAAAGSRAVTVTTYGADQPAAAFALKLRATHVRGTVLVVGHSNTVPEITSALCGCVVTPIAEDDFGNLYRVDIDGRGHATLDHQRY